MNDIVAYTGVDGIDKMLPAGLAYNSQIMLQGNTGIGKSVLAAQFLYEGLVVGDTCIYIACDETPQAMRDTMTGFKFGSLAYEETDKLIFVDAYSRAQSREKHWIPEAAVLDEFYLYEKELLEKYADRRIRLIVDSISTLFMQNDPSTFLAFNFNRLKLLRRMNVLTLDAYVRGVLDDRSIFAIAHTYPVVLSMEFQTVEGGVRRTVQLGKLKSGEFQANRMPFVVDPRTGIIVYNEGGR